MKMTKKKVFVSALAVSLVAILSLGTLAWFSDSDSKNNKFKVATSEDATQGEVFSLEVSESNGTDTISGTSGFTYNDVLPGSVLDKKVVVKNTGYYDQYIRVILTISDLAVWKEIIGEANFATYDIIQHFDGFDATKWDLEVSTRTEDATADTLQYVLYYKEVVKGDHGTDESGATLTVFEKVALPTAMTQEQAAKFGGEFTIDIKAQAVQTENVGAENSAHSCWQAFDTVGMKVTE